MKIEACPFCGSEAKTLKHRYGYGDDAYCVICTKCGCRSRSIVPGEYMQRGIKKNVTVTVEEAILEAIETWNTRSIKTAV